VYTGNPTLLTGTGTTFTPQMVGSQIRVGGLLYPYYTVIAFLSSSQILIDQPWAGPDVTTQPFQILNVYFPVPADFGYFYSVVSVKDGYKLWTNVTQSELALLDPQRTNYGQTYVASFYDNAPSYNGTVGPIITIVASGAVPASTTTTGYSYVANASYVIQIATTGASGTATFRWMRSDQTGFTGTVLTSTAAVDLQDGVQVYFPAGTSYTANDLFIINCQAQNNPGVPRIELWPAPTVNTYLYPYVYIAKEYDLTPQGRPSCPRSWPTVATCCLRWRWAAVPVFPAPIPTIRTLTTTFASLRCTTPGPKFFWKT
jgi:hypothetical protein